MVKTRLVLTVAAAAVLATSIPSQAAPVLRGPSPFGVVKLGDRVEADLSGGCGAAMTRVRAVVRGGTVDGPAVRGCHPIVIVPTAAALARKGWVEGDALSLKVVSGGRSVPLTYNRLEPANAVVAAGSPSVVAKVTDPLGGRTGLAMGTGDAVDLGRVELEGLQSVDVRNLTSGIGQWELRTGSVGGRAIASGQLGAAGSLASAGDAGWYHSQSPLKLRLAQDVVGDANVFGDITEAGTAPRLFLVVVVATGDAVVNWVDLNGIGVARPHRFGVERGFETLFDGSSFDGWDHVGPGRFVLKDGAMRAEHDVQDRGWAWLWWTRAQFTDFNLRLRFKTEDYEDNGGVLLRHLDPQGDPNRSTRSGDEIQIQEGFENLVGGIAHMRDAFRTATYPVGHWNDLEVVSLGRLYVVRINGVEVMRYRTTLATRGFLSVENEQLAGTKGGHLWYDDIRVHRCAGADPVCR